MQDSFFGKLPNIKLPKFKLPKFKLPKFKLQAPRLPAHDCGGDYAMSKKDSSLTPVRRAGPWSLATGILRHFEKRPSQNDSTSITCWML